MSQDGTSETTSPRSNHGAWVRLGRTVVASGTLFQCAATIFLCNRRMELRGKESLMVADHRCFEKDDNGWSLVPLALVALYSLPLLCIGMIFILFPFIALWFLGMLSGVGSILFIKIKEFKMLLGQPPFALASDEFPACPALWKGLMTE